MTQGFDSAEWLSIWGAEEGVYNCSTATFDVGCLDCFGGRDIRIAASPQNQPYITAFYGGTCRQGDPSFTTEILWGGVWVQVLAKICKTMKFRCKIYEAVDHDDSVADSPVLRDVLRGIADIGLSPLINTGTRLNSQNYSIIQSPINHKFSLLIHKRFLSDRDDASLFQQFLLAVYSPEVWLILVVIILLIYIGMVISEKLRSAVVNQQHTWKKVLLDVSMRLSSSTHTDYGISLSHTLHSTFILIVISLGCSVIIQSTFNAMIPVQLTANWPRKAPFSTVQEFLLSDFKVYGSVSVREILMESQNAETRELASRIIPWSNTKNVYEFMARTNNEREVFLIRQANYVNVVNYSCNFVEAVPNVQDAVVSAFWFRRDSPIYSKFIVRFFRTTQTGTIGSDVTYYNQEVIKKVLKLVKTPTECLPHALSTKRKVGRRALRISDLSLSFMGLGVVGGTGSLVLVCEIFLAKIKFQNFIKN